MVGSLIQRLKLTIQLPDHKLRPLDCLVWWLIHRFWWFMFRKNSSKIRPLKIFSDVSFIAKLNTRSEIRARERDELAGLNGDDLRRRPIRCRIINVGFNFANDKTVQRICAWCLHLVWRFLSATMCLSWSINTVMYNSATWNSPLSTPPTKPKKWDKKQLDYSYQKVR